MSEMKTAVDLLCRFLDLREDSLNPDAVNQERAVLERAQIKIDLAAIPADAAEQLKAKDDRIADITSQRDLVQRAYDNSRKKAEARVKELEERNRSLTTALQYAND